MRSWGLSIGMLGPKFTRLYRKEGFMRAMLRGKIYKITHEKGGFGDEVVPLVGIDEFGNRYYEDFTHLGNNQRRWVEFADTGKLFPTVTKKIAPAWHGWLSYTYDDPPRDENFVNPHYRSHRTPVFKTDHPTMAYKNPGALDNVNRAENVKGFRDRQYTAWEPPTGDEPRMGKKIIVNQPANDGKVHEE
mmetsp:Transcript_32400/g.49564  ORF Transcript_32400/g.49564 Transcript_32400/m.49564 type:complete len:189 (+) Transcript_32400:8-574(+)|eukprot:CAMPEP_0170493800 /NCGR_PEP_ID=MMETSP0208-20121228/14276_1 /TAXON_ID=197538 /ORGANISM="Strombidium inclinatum, Strain S3" /LENGTH=188 /DNA_ID=CAMNT_0010769769 /DNA_START=8 /DNA_END=574 /DNA_ORIENTATION=-